MTTIIELPRSPVAAEIDWRPNQPSQVNRSEFTGVARGIILAAAPFWTASVTYPTIIGEAAFRPWRSALMRVQGRANPFRLVAVEGPQHQIYQQVVVDGAGQAGFSLATRGWARGSGLREGMFVTVGDRLLMVVASTAAAGVDGKLVLQVLPQLPPGLADGAAVETLRPWALVTMTSDDVGWKVGRGQQYNVAFDCESVR